MALGIFDSGVGGLTVYRELVKAFPGADLIYLGDTARVPYGSKSPETIVRYALECAGYLTANYNITALVLACNTMSSYAVKALEDASGLPVMGVIQAGAVNAVRATKNRRVGVTGTLATIRSGAYLDALINMDAGLKVIQKACPLFVPLVEEGLIEGPVPRETVKYYLDEVVAEGIDTLILGCTHYPVLAPLIRELYPDITAVDSASVLAGYISRLGLPLEENAAREVLITDPSPAFEALKTMLVGDLGMKKISITSI